jgi:hypothetical protein
MINRVKGQGSRIKTYWTPDPGPWPLDKEVLCFDI